jgi:5-hydroxyisourate hydrolase-like protein (transthyretin family)
VESVLEKTYTLVVKVVDFQRNKPIQNVNVKVFRLEKESITLKQWAENLKNGTPFKRLMISMNTDNRGMVTVELPEGVYETKVEEYGFAKGCSLKQNDEVVCIGPKKQWWR